MIGIASAALTPPLVFARGVVHGCDGHALVRVMRSVAVGSHGLPESPESMADADPDLREDFFFTMTSKTVVPKPGLW